MVVKGSPFMIRVNENSSTDSSLKTVHFEKASTPCDEKTWVVMVFQKENDRLVGRRVKLTGNMIFFKTSVFKFFCTCANKIHVVIYLI